MRYLNTEIFRELRYYFQLIVQRIFLPRGQLNIKDNSRLVLKRLATILAYDIDQSDATQGEELARGLIMSSEKRRWTQLLEHDNIVRHKSVTSSDERMSRLAFTNS
ncbi:hypothetical protein D3C78_506690 [compost metagenome]